MQQSVLMVTNIMSTLLCSKFVDRPSPRIEESPDREPRRGSGNSPGIADVRPGAGRQLRGRGGRSCPGSDLIHGGRSPRPSGTREEEVVEVVLMDPIVSGDALRLSSGP